MPSALTLAGLDPGGGAGVAADLRGFGAAGAFGCAIVTVLTVQSTSGLVRARDVDSRVVMAQLEELMAHQPARVIKTGALGSVANVRAIGAWLGAHPRLPAIVDPVVLPSRGRGRLLAAAGVRVLRDELLPRAWLVTANAPEAEALVGHPVRDVADARRAALALSALGARAALVKGGHLAGPQAVDVLALGGRVVELRAARLSLPPIHGGGCLLAALIAGRLATLGEGGSFEARLLRAIRWARRVHRRALLSPRDVGGRQRVLVP